MKRVLTRYVGITILSALGLTACQATWYPEDQFGSSVNGAIQAQAKNPNAPVGNPKKTPGLDGPAAKNAIDSYQKSFERKQTTQQSSQSGTMVGGTVGIKVQ